MSDPLVIRMMAEFKAGLARREEANLRVMLQRWRQVEERLRGRVEALGEEVARARAAGEITTPGQLYQMERYQALMVQVRAELQQYGVWLTGSLTAWETDVSALGAEQAQKLIRAAGVTGAFNVLPVRAVEYMAGLCADGSPLADLLVRRALWPEAVDGLTRTLTDAIAMGWSPRKTALRMADGLAGGVEKARVIARTEQMRVYRAAAAEQYRESGVVQAMRRVCAKGMRTCLACLAADGELIPLGQQLYDHPQGRCAAIPVLIGREEPEWQRGPEWFAGLSADRQREMMGDSMYKAWDHGKGFEFTALARTAHNDTWGDSLRPAKLEELVH